MRKVSWLQKYPKRTKQHWQFVGQNKAKNFFEMLRVARVLFKFSLLGLNTDFFSGVKTSRTKLKGENRTNLKIKVFFSKQLLGRTFLAVCSPFCFGEGTNLIHHGIPCLYPPKALVSMPLTIQIWRKNVWARYTKDQGPFKEYIANVHSCIRNAYYAGPFQLDPTVHNLILLHLSNMFVIFYVTAPATKKNNFSFFYNLLEIYLK